MKRIMFIGIECVSGPRLSLMIPAFRFLCLLLVLFSSLLACKISAVDNSEQQTYHCVRNLDTLISMIDHIKYGVYDVDLDRFDVSQYEGLTYLELANLGMPVEPENHGVYLFDQFLRTVVLDTACSSEPITIEYLEDKIGPPNTLTHRHPFEGEYALRYFFNLGYGCPNCNRFVSRIFECCGHLTFIVDSNGVKSVWSNILY